MKPGDRVTNEKGWTGVIVEVRQRNQSLMFSDGKLKAGPIYYVNWRERENCPESHPNDKVICSARSCRIEPSKSGGPRIRQL